MIQPRPAPTERPAEIEEAPPFLGTWRKVYVLLAGELLLTVILFYALTRWAS